MIDVVCIECGKEYQLEQDENPENFQCECSGELRFLGHLDDPPANDLEYEKDGIPPEKSYADKNISHFNNIALIGIGIAIIGLIGVLISFFSLIIVFLAIAIFSYGNTEKNKWIKGIKGEKLVRDYLKQLPQDYYVFHDVEFSESYGDLDHVILGPKGIFVIETKNYQGFFVVKDAEWFYKNGRRITKARGQPGKQVIRNSISLKNFLTENGINLGVIRINAIVTLVNKNFKIEKEPKNYKVLFPETIPQYILNSKKKVNIKIIEEAADLISSYAQP